VSSDVHDLVHLGLPWWDKAIRTLVVYLVVLGLLRFFGKRQLAQLNAFDLVVLLLLSNVVQNAIIGNETSLPGGLLGALILLTVNWVLVWLAFERKWLNRLLQGKSTTLYEGGHEESKNLRHELMTREELVAALRRQGMELDDVEKVDLTPDGILDASPKPKPQIEDVMAALDRIERQLQRR
jgi:uncharacterized membrane protein YcaP (DUF421 family)